MRCLALIIFLLIPLSTSWGEVVMDGTLGPGGPLTGPDFAIDASLGTRVGTNLFHSFSDFNLARTETATFSGPSTTTNIITRVTGGRPSTINGTLRSTINRANLYFLNPAGLMFGEGSSLDMSGAFHASTANQLKLGSSGNFPVDPLIPPDLTTDPPSAFGFLTPTPAEIVVDNTLLNTAAKQSLSLVGGDIKISNANLWANNGKMNLVAVASAGEVGLAAGQITTVTNPRLGDITVSETRLRSDQPVYDTPDTPPLMRGFRMANLDVSGDGGGRLFIRGGRFVSSGTTIFNDSYGNETGGMSKFELDGEFSLTDTLLTCNAIFSSGKGAGFSLTADKVQLLDSLINTDSFSGSESGDIDMTIRGGVLLQGSSFISTDANAGGRAGDISISAAALQIDSDARITTSSQALGRSNSGAGNIRFTISGDLALDGQVRSDTGDGMSGSINISAGDLTMGGTGLLSSSLLASSSTASRTSGSIRILTDNLSLRDDARIESRVFHSTNGSGGDIDLSVNNLSLSDRSAVSTSVDSLNGSGGQIRIEAAGDIRVSSVPGNTFQEKGSIASDTTAGKAGGIDLRAANIIVEKGATISSLAEGMQSDGGAISLVAGESILIRGNSQDTTGVNPSSVETDTLQGGTAGDIQLEAPQVEIRGNALVSSAATPSSSGAAGNIDITAESFRMEDASLSTRSQLSTGGNVQVSSAGRVHLTRSDLSATASGGSGNGGNVSVQGANVVMNASSMTAQADQGNGGNLLIRANMVTLSNDSFLSASSRLGAQGTIIIDSPVINLGNDQAEPAVEFANPDDFLPRRCLPPGAPNASTFRVTGKAGIIAPLPNRAPVMSPQ